MYIDDFKIMLSKLFEYYGADRHIDKGQLDQWFKKVRDIPTEASTFIHDRITSNSESIPRNPPKHIIAYFFEWKNLNQDKLLQFPKTKCDECYSTGFIVVRRPAIKDNRQLTYVKWGTKRKKDSEPEIVKYYEVVSYRCGKCENWKSYVHEKTMPAITNKWAQEQGVEVIQFPKTKSTQPQDINQITGNIGTKI